MLPVRLDRRMIAALARQCEDGSALGVDPNRCTVTAPDGTVVPFQIDDYRRQGLLLGLSDIEMSTWS